MTNTLYISNNGSYISLDIGDIHVSYLGPINLIRFIRVNRFDGGVVHVETEFADCIEEEYIDVAYALSETDCDIPEVLKSITSVKIR